jgi:hypothetical protein
MKKEIINEIINRITKAYVIELKGREAWVLAGFPEETAPTAIGLIGTAETGYECLRGAWWKSLGCDKLADGLDYLETAHEIERTAEIPNLPIKRRRKIMTPIPKTTNTEWGFYGTINTQMGYNEEITNKIWDAMVTRIDHLHQRTSEEIVAFLDSRIGRHLADDIGVNIGKRNPTKILRMIKDMPIEYMEKWWVYYAKCP